MNKILREQLEAVINSTIKGDTKSAEAALSEYLRFKAQTLLSEELDEEDIDVKGDDEECDDDMDDNCDDDGEEGDDDVDVKVKLDGIEDEEKGKKKTKAKAKKK